MFSDVIFYFYCWYSVRSWKQICVLTQELVRTSVIPIFVTVLSVKLITDIDVLLHVGLSAVTEHYVR